MEKIYQQAIQCYADFLKNNLGNVSDKVITYNDITTINTCLGTNVSVQIVDWNSVDYDD